MQLTASMLNLCFCSWTVFSLWYTLTMISVFHRKRPLLGRKLYISIYLPWKLSCDCPPFLTPVDLPACLSWQAHVCSFFHRVNYRFVFSKSSFNHSNSFVLFLQTKDDLMRCMWWVRRSSIQLQMSCLQSRKKAYRVNKTATIRFEY